MLRAACTSPDSARERVERAAQRPHTRFGAQGPYTSWSASATLRYTASLDRLVALPASSNRNDGPSGASCEAQCAPVLVGRISAAYPAPGLSAFDPSVHVSQFNASYERKSAQSAVNNGNENKDLPHSHFDARETPPMRGAIAELPSAEPSESRRVPVARDRVLETPLEPAATVAGSDGYMKRINPRVKRRRSAGSLRERSAALQSSK